MKLKIAGKKCENPQKHKYHMLLNNKWVMEKIKGEIKKKYLEINEGPTYEMQQR